MSDLAGIARRSSRALDDRLASANFLRRSLNKVFPDHWSFMLGEIALFSFVVLLLTGVYLTFFFDPSAQEVRYNGSYVPLKGVEMSRAYASTLDISFDTRAGLVFRQIHHWAALLFVASIVVHLSRIFFTGAFRKPREINWLIGVGLLVLALAEGFCGYSLPDDLLSGTGLRIAYSIALSIPVVGTWLAFLFFGGEFPGTSLIPRLYVIHILLVPGVLLALISAHMGILWHQKHTQFPGPGRTEHNVVGSRVFPHYGAKSVGFFMLLFGILALLGGLAQINPIWVFGPYDPAQVSAASQPDWYIGFLDGSLRLFPPWEFRGLGHDVPPLLWPGVVLPLVLFGLLAAYPFLERRITGDRAYHNLLDRPRDSPTRTAIGAMALSFYAVLLASGGNDVLATTFHISLNALVWAGRICAATGLLPGHQAAVPGAGAPGARAGRAHRDRGRRAAARRRVRRGGPARATAAGRAHPVQPGHPAGDSRYGGLAGRIGRAIGGFFLARTSDGQAARVGARRAGGEEQQ